MREKIEASGVFEKCTMTNEELRSAVNDWTDKLCKSGGKAWCLQVPVNFNKDPDMLMCALVERFSKLESDYAELERRSRKSDEQIVSQFQTQGLLEKEIKELEEQVTDTENALTGAITCIELLKCCSNCGLKPSPYHDCMVDCSRRTNPTSTINNWKQKENIS